MIKDWFLRLIKNLHQGIQVKLFSVFWFNESCELYLVGWHKCLFTEAYFNTSQHSLPWDSKPKTTCQTKYQRKRKQGWRSYEVGSWHFLTCECPVRMYSMSCGLQWLKKPSSNSNAVVNGLQKKTFAIQAKKHYAY